RGAARLDLFLRFTPNGSDFTRSGPFFFLVLVNQHVDRHAQHAGEIPKVAELGLVDAALPPADDHDGYPDCLRGVIGAARSRSSRRSRRGGRSRSKEAGPRDIAALVRVPAFG